MLSLSSRSWRAKKPLNTLTTVIDCVADSTMTTTYHSCHQPVVVNMSCGSVIDVVLLLTGDYEGALARLTEMTYLLQEHVSHVSSAGSSQRVMWECY